MSRAGAIVAGTTFGATAATLTAGVAFAESGRGFGRDRRGDGFFMILPLLVLVAVAVLLVVLWRRGHLGTTAPATPPPPPVSPTFNAQVILADRLARGEIGPDEYRAAITVLREGQPPPG
jgi:putative membrane protein